MRFGWWDTDLGEKFHPDANLWSGRRWEKSCIPIKFVKQHCYLKTKNNNKNFTKPTGITDISSILLFIHIYAATCL